MTPPQQANHDVFNLVQLNDPRTWDRVEESCAELIDKVPNLKQYERNLEALGTAKEYFTKPELDAVVLWKHTVGKNRIYNVKYLNTNTDASVQEHSRAAIALALCMNMEECQESDGSLSVAGRKAMQECIGELGKLKGVGPATASAVLTLVRPDMFCYLYDEVIDCFEPQRDYKISNYLRVNSRCLQIAKTLGGSWTSSRVAKTIWTAARFLAAKGTYRAHPNRQLGHEQQEQARMEDEDDEDYDEEVDNEDEEEEEQVSEVATGRPKAKSKRDVEVKDDDDDEIAPDAVVKLPNAKRSRKE